MTTKLREWTARAHPMLSARDEEHDKVAALDAGANDYLTKPFGTGELLARIRVWLRHTQRATSDSLDSTLEVGDLRIDFGKRLAFVDGREVRLTPTQYKLFGTLMRNAGKVLTHEQILFAVWGPAYTKETQYLRVLHGATEAEARARPGQAALPGDGAGRGLSPALFRKLTKVAECRAWPFAGAPIDAGSRAESPSNVDIRSPGHIMPPGPRSPSVSRTLTSVCIFALAASAVSCSPTAQWDTKLASGFAPSGRTVSVLRRVQGRPNELRGVGRAAPRLEPVLGGRACEIVRNDRGVDDPLFNAVDDYTRTNGPTDDLLAQLAPASQGDLILVLVEAGRLPPPEKPVSVVNSRSPAGPSPTPGKGSAGLSAFSRTSAPTPSGRTCCSSRLRSSPSLRAVPSRSST